MSMMFSGKFVVFALIVLTGIVGALFIYIGPKALKTNPGVFHIGIRYADEFGMEFTRHPKGGPGATLAIIDTDGQIIERFDSLVIGRNLVPIDVSKLTDDTYLLEISAMGYSSQKIPANLQGKVFYPITNASSLNEKKAKADALFDFTFDKNLLGVRLYPKTFNGPN